MPVYNKYKTFILGTIDHKLVEIDMLCSTANFTPSNVDHTNTKAKHKLNIVANSTILPIYDRW